MERKLGIGKIVISAVAFIAVIILLIFLSKLFESVDANEIVVIQDAFDGELHWYATQGIKWQGLGKVTRYQKRSVYEFMCRETGAVKTTVTDPKTKQEQEVYKEQCVAGQDFSIKVRFNDGGHGSMHGTIQYELPLDDRNLT